MGSGGEAIDEIPPAEAVEYDPDLPPELVQKALDLGIDPNNPEVWKQYQWVADEFNAATLPEPWSEYSDEQGQIFYYDHNSGESQWTHPLLGTFRTLFLKCQEEPGLHEYYKDLYHNLRQYCDDKKGWWALNLLSTPNGGPPPTPEEVHDMAVYLQVDIPEEPDLMWVSKQAVQVALPPNWEELEDAGGNVYFYDKTTGKSTMKHPMDDYFFALVHEERKKLKAKREEMSPEARARSLWMPFLDDDGATYFVNFTQGVHTYFPPWEEKYHIAARSIQARYQLHSLKNKKNSTAALTIQRIYRGHVVRDAVAAWKMECAVLCIQTMWRMYKARDNLLRERAAVLMQSAYRMHAARGRYREEVGALRVQKHYRRHAAQGELRRRRKERAAAVQVQKMERGRQARKEVVHMREEKAAVVIQKNFRMHTGKQQMGHAKAHVKQELAALEVQRVYRGHLGRRDFRAAQEAAAATVIQSYARMWLAMRLLGQAKGAVAIQRHWRGHTSRARVRWLQENKARDLEHKATVIQARYRGHASRRAAKKDLSHQLFIVIRMQFMFRKFVRQRRERIDAMMRAWEDALVARVQAKWKGMVQRKKFLREVAQHRREDAAAGGIQRVWRGARGRRAAKVRAGEVGEQTAAATKIQAQVRARAARATLEDKKRLMAEREELLAGLTPMYEACYSLPKDPADDPARAEMVARHILQDVQVPPGAEGDRVSEPYVQALRERTASLESDCYRRKRQREDALSELSLLWRLLKVPTKRWLTLPPEGEPGWLSDAVLSKCTGEMGRLGAMKEQGAKPLCGEAAKLMGALFDELCVRDVYSDGVNAACNPAADAPPGPEGEPAEGYAKPPFDKGSLDGMIKEILRLEGLRPYVAEVLSLSLRAAELSQLRATLPPPNSKSIMMEKSIAAKKRRAEEEKLRSMVNKEYPEAISKLRVGVNELQRAEDLPVPFEELDQIFPIPTPQQIRQMIDAEIRYRQDANSAQRSVTAAAPVFTVPIRRSAAAKKAAEAAVAKKPSTPVAAKPAAAPAAEAPAAEAEASPAAAGRRPKRRQR